MTDAPAAPPAAPGGPLAPPAAAPEARRVPVRLPAYRVRLMYVFLGLIGLVFAAQAALAQLIGADLVIAYGAKINSLIAQGQIWRLLTAVFVHANVLHLLFNAYALYHLGSAVETTYGPVRFGLVFLFAGLSGSVTSMLLTPSPSVGASGAIFGLIGAEAVFLYRNRRIFGERGRRSLQNIIGIGVINLLIGLQGSIDNWAHFGGLIAGLALSWLTGPVWAVNQEPAPDGAPVLVDRQPLAGARWAAVLILGTALAALAGLAIALRR